MMAPMNARVFHAEAMNLETETETALSPTVETTDGHPTGDGVNESDANAVEDDVQDCCSSACQGAWWHMATYNYRLSVQEQLRERDKRLLSPSPDSGTLVERRSDGTEWRRATRRCK